MAHPDTLLLIDGEWRPAAAGEWIAVENPATEAVIGRVAHARAADIDAAAEAAARAFPAWAATPAIERAALIRGAARLLRERSDAIAATITAEQGKPLAEAKHEIQIGAGVLDWFSEEAMRLYGRTIPARGPGVLPLTIRQPVGPVAAFAPWNMPINQVVRKVAAALTAGCTLVIKAAEETPAASAEVLRAVADAGVPAGVVNLLYGTPAEISERLIAHPAIRKISFTGSTKVGKQLAALAGAHMKRVTMELGGHAPAIICADADLDKAATLLGHAKFRNAGQICMAPTRFLIEDSVFEPMVARLVAHAGALKVGDGTEPGVQMGPLANGRRVSELTTLVADALAQGATLRLGGERLGNVGHFFAPTVLADVPTTARIMNEEPFGPVIIANRFSTLSDALAEANRLPYGLASFAFTGSLATAHTLAHGIEAGMLTVNQLGLAVPETPFGGVKESGYGSEGGPEALDPYLVTKFVSLGI